MFQGDTFAVKQRGKDSMKPVGAMGGELNGFADGVDNPP
jgi:hypothetical protein